jgi:hypothetical protein
VNSKALNEALKAIVLPRKQQTKKKRNLTSNEVQKKNFFGKL